MFLFMAYVFQHIMSYATSQIWFPNSWSYLRDLTLADPNPTSRQYLLIGVDLYGSLLLSNLRQGPLSISTAQKTTIGWIISIPTGIALNTVQCRIVFPNITQTRCSVVSFGKMRRFLSNYFLRKKTHNVRNISFTYSRISDGRYMMRLSFKTGNPIDIGDSLLIIIILYARMESRLQSQLEIRNIMTFFANISSSVICSLYQKEKFHSNPSISYIKSRFKQYHEITHHF